MFDSITSLASNQASLSVRCQDYVTLFQAVVQNIEDHHPSIRGPRK